MGNLVKMDERDGLGGSFSFSSNRSHKVNAERKNIPYFSQDFKEGIKFIMSHFQEPLFPRTISTKFTSNTQITVFNIEQVYEEFEKSNFIDCRISAFPLIDSLVPNFVFIDLDRNDNSQISTDKKLAVTLTNIKKRLGSSSFSFRSSLAEIFLYVGGFKKYTLFPASASSMA